MRTKKGIVTSNKMMDTIVVSVTTYKVSSKYKKKFKTTSKFYAHDEWNTCNEWDTVIIVETTPISKLKRWKLQEKLS